MRKAPKAHRCHQPHGVNYRGQCQPAEFGVRDVSENCPPDFVMFDNSKLQNTPFQAKRSFFPQRGTSSRARRGILPLHTLPSPCPNHVLIWIRPCVPRIPVRLTPMISRIPGSYERPTRFTSSPYSSFVGSHAAKIRDVKMKDRIARHEMQDTKTLPSLILNAPAHHAHY